MLSLQRSAGNALVARRLGSALASGGPTVARSPASDLIDGHTSLLDLDERALGRDLLRRALAGDTAIVMQVLDELGSTDRDDVSYELTSAASEGDLQSLAGSEPGRRLLDRLFDELTSGSVAAEEQQQADRVMRVKGARIDPAQFDRALAQGMRFPHKLPGITVLNDAPIMAERRPGGRIWVKLPVRVLGTSDFRDETRTLPADVFTSGLEMPEDTVISVRLYDLGGVLVTRPALFLVQVSNATTTQVLMSMIDAAAIGLTLGSGALATRGASLAARMLIAADRVAFAAGVITTVIRDHRGWILQKFGTAGRRFLDVVDVVNSVVLIYGGVRALVGMGQLLSGLRQSAARWREAASAVEAELTAEQQAVVRQVNQHSDEVLQQVQAIERESAAAAGGSRAPGAAPDGAPGGGAAGAAPEPQPGGGGPRTPGPEPPGPQGPGPPGPEPPGPADPRRELLATLEARMEQIRAARGDVNAFRARLRAVTSRGDTARPLADLGPELDQLLTPYRRARVVTGGGRGGSGVSTYIESLDGQFSIRITHNQVGPSAVGSPPHPRIHLYEGQVAGHGRHVILPDGTTLDDILRAIGVAP